MAKILQLFEVDFVKNLLTEKALPLYPDYIGIEKLEIKQYKKMVWGDRYHVVLEFITSFITKDKKQEEISIFCSAHDSEPRKNVYTALKYLWENNFPGDGIDIPKPLFFSQEFNGVFYEGIRGDNLYQYIKKGEVDVIKKMVIQSAHLFARLHRIPAGKEANINTLNSRIETSIPGVEAIYQKMDEHYGKDNPYTSVLRKMYDIFITQENENLKRTDILSVIHGDAHSENLVRTGEDRIGLIDFTDLCVSDFARDLGTFMQQFEYKMTLKVMDTKVTKELKDLFLKLYLQDREIELDDDLKKRIDLYYNWTAIRSAVFLFLKYDNDQSGAEALFNAIKHKLNL